MSAAIIDEDLQTNATLNDPADTHHDSAWYVVIEQPLRFTLRQLERLCRQIHFTIPSSSYIFKLVFVCMFVPGAAAPPPPPPQWARSSSFTRFLDHTQRRTTVGRT
jgi:hypothetical protein